MSGLRQRNMRGAIKPLREPSRDVSDREPTELSTPASTALDSDTP